MITEKAGLGRTSKDLVGPFFDRQKEMLSEFC